MKKLVWGLILLLGSLGLAGGPTTSAQAAETTLTEQQQVVALRSVLVKLQDYADKLEKAAAAKLKKPSITEAAKKASTATKSAAQPTSGKKKNALLDEMAGWFTKAAGGASDYGGGGEGGIRGEDTKKATEAMKNVDCGQGDSKGQQICGKAQKALKDDPEFTKEYKEKCLGKEGDYGNKACACAVSIILKQPPVSMLKEIIYGTEELAEKLPQNGFEEINGKASFKASAWFRNNFYLVAQASGSKVPSIFAKAEPGDVIVSPKQGGRTGHTGICMNSGCENIGSNSSSRKKFMLYYTNISWTARFKSNIYIFRAKEGDAEI